MIDRIEFNIQQSIDFITSANADTKKAIKFQQEARRVSFKKKQQKKNKMLNVEIL